MLKAERDGWSAFAIVNLKNKKKALGESCAKRVSDRMAYMGIGTEAADDGHKSGQSLLLGYKLYADIGDAG